jgi:hypothetical protein
LWCDQFGIRKKKAMMIAILQTGVPLGIVVGYAMTSVIKESFQVINKAFIYIFNSGNILLLYKVDC